MVTSQMSLFPEINSFRVISLVLLGIKKKGYTNMLQYVCSIEWKIEIGCHGCSVSMVTSQKSRSVL